jgi:hypothetical protein
MAANVSNENKATMGSMKSNVVFTKKEKVPRNLSLVDHEELKLIQVPLLKEAIGIYIVTTTGTVSYTVHRPVGINNLPPDEWVITPTKEVRRLLLRSKDPNQKSINEQRVKYQTELLYDNHILVKGENGDQMYPDDVPKLRGHSRRSTLNLARKKLKEAKTKAIEEYETSQKAKGLKKWKPMKYSKGSLDFLPKTAKEYENLITKFLQSDAVKAKVEEKVPQTYFTGTGTRGDVPQVPMFLKGKTLVQVTDLLSGEIEDFTSKAKDVPPAEKPADTESVGTVKTSLMKRLFQKVAFKSKKKLPASANADEGKLNEWSDQKDENDVQQEDITDYSNAFDEEDDEDQIDENNLEENDPQT